MSFPADILIKSLGLAQKQLHILSPDASCPAALRKLPNMPDIPAFPRLARQAPPCLKSVIIFCANP
jgi:hypothetical protein